MQAGKFASQSDASAHLTLPVSGGSRVFLYGPPGSGKSTVGRSLAQALNLPFWDLDSEIEALSGMTIPEIFALEQEVGFRQREKVVLNDLLNQDKGVIALGGGALLDAACRAQVESAGPVLCLTAPLDVLQDRLQAASIDRPLLSRGRTEADQAEADNLSDRLASLLAARAAHYASFPVQLDTAKIPPQHIVREAQISLGAFHVSGMGAGYDVRVQPGGMSQLGEALRSRLLNGPIALVSDQNVGRLYAHLLTDALKSSGFSVQLILIPPGEGYKTMQTVSRLWEGFLSAGLERTSTVVAMGGGVVGDLAGFAAAAFLRGIRWVVLPTSLLAMVDSSLGGKTGADLPQGKNLVGAFHPPSLVLSDPASLETLPETELRSGMAEVVKHGLIGDPNLFERCAQGWQAVRADWSEIVRRAMAVKIEIIQADPFEKGRRAALNLGHTVGHAVELASGFRLRHGEAVAIGLVAEARLAERLGLAEHGLTGRITDVLQALDLPTQIQANLDREEILRAMGVDKKRLGGKVRFSLPVSVGEVALGVEAEDLSALF